MKIGNDADFLGLTMITKDSNKKYVSISDLASVSVEIPEGIDLKDVCLSVIDGRIIAHHADDRLVEYEISDVGDCDTDGWTLDEEYANE